MYSEKTPIISKVIFMHVSYAKRPCFKVKARPFSSLTFRKSGSITVSSKHGELLSGQGSLTFIPKGCEYESEILESGEMYVMHFYTLGDEDEKPECAQHDFPVSVSNLFANAYERYSSSGSDLACMSMAYELLSEAKTALSGHEVHPHRRMRECKRYIDENIFDTSLRINELAEMCGISEVYFRREFKKFYGTSPIEYIKKRRIDTAKSLLQTGMCSITETALQSGFDSVSYFSYEFRRATGMTPSEYARFKNITE